MEAVIGAAQTLQGRWRELTTGQRLSFLVLIGDETSRLASPIGDVLLDRTPKAETRQAAVSGSVATTSASSRIGCDHARNVGRPMRGHCARMRPWSR
jgi:hypothetical protein